MSEQYFRPRNWARHQGYKKRGPKWIRLHTALLTDPDFIELTERQQLCLIKLWLSYAAHGRALPAPPKRNGRTSARARAHVGRALGTPLQHVGRVFTALLSSNFIELCGESVADSAIPCDKTGPPETETETETEKKVRAARSAPPASKPTPRSELEGVLDPERAQAVIDHRQRIRKPLTAHAAKLLAGKLAKWPDPNEAADAMVANGWQGFEVAWLEGRGKPNGTGPPGLVDTARELMEENERANGHIRQDDSGISEAEGGDTPALAVRR